MIRHNVWTIVPRTKNIQVVPVKWLFGIKDDQRRKARLVAIGCRDPKIYSSVDKASPTPCTDTFR